MTVEALGAEIIELVPELKSFVPPAVVFDKKVYSPWSETSLHAYLTGHSVDTFGQRNRCLCLEHSPGRCRQRLSRGRCHRRAM